MKLLLALFCFGSLSFAYDYLSDNDIYIEKSTPPSGKQGYETISSQEITPNAGPRVASGADVFFTGDYIWWKASEDGTAYAQSGFPGQNGILTGRGRFYHPHFNFKSGFKAGIGLNLGHDGWDFYAEYTWLRENNGTSSTDRPDIATSNLRPTWQTVLSDGTLLPTNTPLLFASGRWNFHFNVIDFEMGRNFFISEYLTLRPHVGFKGTWQRQRYRVRYLADLNPPPLDLFLNDLRMKMEENYWGIGIRSGLDTAWHMGAGFSIFGDIILTALWTDFDIDRTDSEALVQGDVVFSSFNKTLNTQNTVKTLKGILECDIGLRWDAWWSDDHYHFGLQAGWEEQIWWSNNQYISLVEESAHGDLVIHGLTIKARLDF